ncbi:MAG: enoyl-CoA hydratase/isomerase [Duganella sp.]
MGSVEPAPYANIVTRREGEICYLQLHRPHANNTISDAMIDECNAVLHGCAGWARVLVLEGLPEVFCFGADLQQIGHHTPDAQADRQAAARSADALYGLWLQLKRGPFVSIAHVRGKVNAGGVGFAAACDLVLCDEQATFGLSELLFGLMPACVLPFLIDRIGSARAHAMTLMTQPVTARQALAWGLADGCADDSANLLRMHLLRLRLLSREAIVRYKRYMASLDDAIEAARPQAVAGNADVFSDPATLARIARYAVTGRFPWEADIT